MDAPGLKVVYFGTSPFAVPALEALAAHSAARVVGVVTQPDKRAGRDMSATRPPVAVAAEKLGLVTLQPLTLKDPAVEDALRALAPDIFVVAAYGKIIPKTLLAVPRLGSVNLHGSILPKFRGASPIQAAILEGEAETGVSLMVMDEQVDHGSVVDIATCAIAPDETYATLEKKLATLGADLLARHMPIIAADIAAARPQNHEAATFTRIIGREDGMLSWATEDAARIERKSRAYEPWPGVYTAWVRGGKTMRLKIGALRVLPTGANSILPGTVMRTPEGGIAVAAAGGTAVELLALQPEGKKMIDARTFLNGYPDVVGAALQGHDAK